MTKIFLRRIINNWAQQKSMKFILFGVTAQSSFCTLMDRNVLLAHIRVPQQNISEHGNWPSSYLHGCSLSSLRLTLPAQYHSTSQSAHHCRLTGTRSSQAHPASLVEKAAHSTTVQPSDLHQLSRFWMENRSWTVCSASCRTSCSCPFMLFWRSNKDQHSAV